MRKTHYAAIAFVAIVISGFVAVQFYTPNRSELTVSDWSYKYESSNSEYVFTVTMNNGYQKQIKYLDGWIVYKDSMGDIITSAPLSKDSLLPSHATTVISAIVPVSLDISDESRRLEKMRKDTLSANIEILNIAFEDGTTLSRLTTDEARLVLWK